MMKETDLFWRWSNILLEISLRMKKSRQNLANTPTKMAKICNIQPKIRKNAETVIKNWHMVGVTGSVRDARLLLKSTFSNCFENTFKLPCRTIANRKTTYKNRKSRLLAKSSKLTRISSKFDTYAGLPSYIQRNAGRNGKLRSYCTKY